jgi:hypothetical protein
MPTQTGDFDLQALYAALDAQRTARGLTWHQAATAISQQFWDSAATPISASTLTGMRGRRFVEGDGVVQMLRWLNRSPESFMPGNDETAGAPWPPVGSRQILRFDARAIAAALDEKRHQQSLTWAKLAREVGASAPGLAALATGGRVAFPEVMRVLRWLGRPAAEFMRAADS